MEIDLGGVYPDGDFEVVTSHGSLNPILQKPFIFQYWDVNNF